MVTAKAFTIKTDGSVEGNREISGHPLPFALRRLLNR